LVVGAAEPDTGTSVETKIALGRMSSGTPVDVTASFGDGLNATGQLTLDCSNEYKGDAIFVNIEPEGPVSVNLNFPCYSEFPNNEVFQGGSDQQ
jgi:hypothetical protein